MADLTNGSGVYQTYSNAGAGVAELSDNKSKLNCALGDTQGIAGKTRIYKMAKSSITDAEVDSIVELMMAGGTSGTDDAVTVVGVDKNTNEAYIAVQGTGVLAPDGGSQSNYRGVTGVTATLETTFDGLKA